MFTDASDVGWGATTSHLQAAGIWNPDEAQVSINLRELRAIRLGLEEFQQQFQGRNVGILSDNSTALAYLRKEGGTRSALLNKEAQRILQWAEDHNVTLFPQFIPGKRNIVADSLSRPNEIIASEWTLHQEVVDELRRKWPTSVDLFATHLNHRLPTYFSTTQDPMSAGTDAFLQRWDHLDAYAYPPQAVIQRVLNKLRQSQGTNLTLIAPDWPQQAWYADLQEMLIDHPVALPSRVDLLRQPHFHRRHLNLQKLRLTGWRLSGDLRKQKAFQRQLQTSLL